LYKEVLNENQLELLPLIKQFKREFYLVGGTAIALHLGHRRSIDFDLFKPRKITINRFLRGVLTMSDCLLYLFPQGSQRFSYTSSNFLTLSR